MFTYPRLPHILLLAVLLWGGEYVARDFWEPDEARYVYVAREMRANGNWAVPTRHGELYAHKPPLMFWLMNAGASLTGGEINRVAARLPSLLGMVLSLGAITRIARRWADNAAAWRVLWLLPTTYLMWNKGGMAQIDGLLCGLEWMGLYFLVAYEERPAAWRAAAAYLMMGLAVTAKGPVGFIIPLGMYIAGTLAAGGPARPRRLHLHYAWGPLLVLIPAALWLLGAWWSDAPPAYFHELLYKQNVERAAGEFGHTKPFYYFLVHFPIEFLPWTPLWLAVAPAFRALPDRRQSLRRLLAATLFVVVFFSLSPSKRELYILPAYPAAALLAAIAWPAAGPTLARACTIWFRAFLALAATALTGAALADLLNPALLPIPGAALLPSGLLAAAGAYYVHRQTLRHGHTSDRTVLSFATAVAAVLISVSTLVYAALNPLKGPYAVAAAARQFLAAPDAPVHLYKIHGEIMPLYAQRTGSRIVDAAHLKRALRQQTDLLLVLEKKSLPEIDTLAAGAAHRGEFTMGHKQLLWLHFTPASSTPPAPAPPPTTPATPPASTPPHTADAAGTTTG